VAGHLRQAREIAASGRLRDRYRAYWHLAQAAAMAGNGPLKRRITVARQAWPAKRRRAGMGQFG